MSNNNKPFKVMDARPIPKDLSCPRAKFRTGTRFLERYRKSSNLQIHPTEKGGARWPKFPKPKNFAKPAIYVCISVLYWDKPLLAAAYGILAIIEVWSHILNRPRSTGNFSSSSKMELQNSQPNHERQAEADILLMSVDELEEMERLAEEEKQADAKGLEVWEWKLLKNGATAEQIEAERKRIDKEIGDIIDD